MERRSTRSSARFDPPPQQQQQQGSWRPMQPSGFGGQPQQGSGGFGGQPQQGSGGFGGQPRHPGGGFGGPQQPGGGFGGQPQQAGGGFGGQSPQKPQGTTGFGGGQNQGQGGAMGLGGQAPGGSPTFKGGMAGAKKPDVDNRTNAGPLQPTNQNVEEVQPKPAEPLDTSEKQGGGGGEPSEITAGKSNGDASPAKKRKLPPWMRKDAPPQPKRPKFVPLSKTPMMALHEFLMLQCKKISEIFTDLPKNADMYECKIVLEDIEYLGRALSKKMARQAACESALRHSKILPEARMEEVAWFMPPPPVITPGMSEEAKKQARTLTISTKAGKAVSPGQMISAVCPLLKLQEVTSNQAKYEVIDTKSGKAVDPEGDDAAEDLKDTDVSMDDGSEKTDETSSATPGKKPAKRKPRFECTVTIGDKKFTAKGRKKVLTKRLAAWTALKEAYGIVLPYPDPKSGKASKYPSRDEAVAMQSVATLPMPPFAGNPWMMSPKGVGMGMGMGMGMPPMPMPPNQSADPSTTPAAILNVRMPGLEYVFDVEADGTKVCRVTINQKTYTGKGKNKKDAKQEACRTILDQVYGEQVPTPGPKGPAAAAAGGPKDEFMTISSVMAKANEKIKAMVGSKNPISLMGELYGQTAVFEELPAPMGPGSFCVNVRIGQWTYSGTGKSKKAAKAGACRAALVDLHQAKLNSATGDLMSPSYDENADFSSDVGLMSDLISFDSAPSKVQAIKQDLADSVAMAVNSKYEELTSSNPVAQKRKVIAGVVMTRGMDPSTGVVLCVTSGTKCVAGDGLSLYGDVLQDCHAEILAKRCMRRLFLDQIKQAFEGEPDSIFRFNPEGTVSLKEGLDFHLYISSAPCGDSRIFCAQNKEKELADRGFARKSRGLLRTKVESGEGTIPISAEAGVIQTFDAILAGERLLTMSCSDKVCRWNVTGFQGALLSTLLDQPIYFTSVILGSLYHPQHLQRALVGRLQEHLGDLPLGYKLNYIHMGAVSSPEERGVSKSPSHSINWITGSEYVEVVNSTTGKRTSTIPEFAPTAAPGDVSRLCKKVYFKEWCDVVGLVFGPQQTVSYAATKTSASKYQEAKKAANAAFLDGGYSHWVKKPVEVDMFNPFV